MENELQVKENELRVKEIESIPAGDNPFCHNFFLMGNKIGGENSHLMAMYESFDPSALVLIDTTTGRRWWIRLPRPTTSTPTITE
jgi:hypothetical protein